MYENKFTTVDFENHKRKFAGALKEIFGVTFWPYNKSFIDQACSVKMAEYWPRSFFAFLWTSSSSRSIKTQKKNFLTSRMVNNAYIQVK